jgi:hypothetical protein
MAPQGSVWDHKADKDLLLVIIGEGQLKGINWSTVSEKLQAKNYTFTKEACRYVIVACFIHCYQSLLLHSALPASFKLHGQVLSLSSLSKRGSCLTSGHHFFIPPIFELYHCNLNPFFTKRKASANPPCLVSTSRRSAENPMVELHP